ncbi:uncharacterized protein [Eurosta solidaginis]|uniref:uncharacterized protein n=1 Tax=Eurosta solidaginis TaxID=178769 RepID=UPI0035311F4E
MGNKKTTAISTNYEQRSKYVSRKITDHDTERDLIYKPDKSTPRSILRRPDGDESDTLFIPKKRVRFADQEVVESNDTFFSEAGSNEIESAYNAKENGIKNRGNATFVIEQSADIPFKSDTETIEIFSTGEMEKRETMRAEGLTKQKVNKPVFVKANKLLKKAKLMGSQKMTNKGFKSCKSRVDNGKSKIEIQQCRIIKPFSTKLPTKLPIDQEEQAIKSPKTRNSSTNASPATKSEVKIFKSQQRPPKRKAAKLSDCEVYFRKFLQQQSDSDEDNKTGKATTTALLAFEKSSHTKEEENSKPKRKKSETDFDRFFRETLNNGSHESDNDPSKLGEAVISKEGDDGFLQFSTKLDESSAFFGNNVDDFFAGPSNNEKDDGYGCGEKTKINWLTMVWLSLGRYGIAPLTNYIDFHKVGWISCFIWIWIRQPHFNLPNYTVNNELHRFHQATSPSGPCFSIQIFLVLDMATPFVECNEPVLLKFSLCR